VKKELQLGTLRAVRVINNTDSSNETVEIVRPFLKLKHRQRFQTRISKTFEQLLLDNKSLAVAS
jgi:predicted nucleotide-binding protein (sugar kinase/HSP70/actin superfamily)